MIRIFGTVFAALAGLAFGSFLNVLVTRWPEGESVVRPRSHCRHCDHVLAWWENIPLVSWVMLRGRCRACREWIGWRYAIVEAAVGACWGFIAFEGSPSNDQLSFDLLLALTIYVICRLIFVWLLIALAVLDFEHFWLPDKITIPGILVGFAANAFYVAVYSFWNGIFDKTHVIRGQIIWRGSWERLLEVAAAAAFLLLIRWLYWLFRRRQGLGLGDVKLMAMIAAWLGLRSAVLALVIAVLLGTLAALVLLVVPAWRREPAAKWAATPLPFGTFLCVGGIVSSLWGAQMISAYLHWAGF